MSVVDRLDREPADNPYQRTIAGLIRTFPTMVLHSWGFR